VARVKDIAARMNVTMSSVNGAIKNLVARGLCDHDRYGYVDLTPDGEKAAARMVNRHAILARFLHSVLGVDADSATADACEMEHVISPRTLDRLVLFLTFIGGCERGAAEMIEHFHEYIRHGECKEECPECGLTHTPG
jgi:DtxR family Mn-dependent transcriptional regulator